MNGTVYAIEALDPLPSPTLMVYRLYDQEMRLLYVGMTEHWRQRIKRHRRSQPWGQEIRFFRLEEVRGSRRDAEAIEARAIVAELPIHNVAGHPNYIQTEYGAGASL